MKITYCNFVNLLSYTGAVLIVLGVVFAGSFSHIFKYVLNSKLVLTRDSELFEMFEHVPVPLYEKYYFFNVTNPDGFQYDNEKAQLQEVGPYTYKKKIIKKNIRFSEDGNYVTYDRHFQYTFSREDSVGDESDLVTTPNAILVVLGGKIKGTNYLLKNLGGLFLSSFNIYDLFVTKSVGELLYYGYEDPLADLASTIYDYPEISGGKFGYRRGSNNSKEASYRVHTGKGAIESYMQLEMVNEDSSLNTWKDDKCDAVAEAALGIYMPPDVQKFSKTKIVSVDVCRKVDLKYDRETDVNGVPAYEFIPTDDLYKTMNTCYCRDSSFCKDGLANLGNCKVAPVFLSCPHFYEGDPTLLDEVDGLSPSKEKHETSIKVNPTTGIVMDGKKRLQFSLPIDKYDGIPAFEYVNKTVFPVLWAEESATAPVEITDMLKMMTEMPFIVAYGISAFLVVMGIINLIVWHIIQLRSGKKNNQIEKEMIPIRDDKAGEKLLQKT